MKSLHARLAAAAVLLANLAVASPAAGAVMCGGHEATIVGSSESETLEGTPDGDVIHGGLGKDEIFGGGGNDVICGAADADDLSGGPGNDRLFGSTARDTLDGGEGHDELRGGSYSDTLAGGPGDDGIFGGNDNVGRIAVYDWVTYAGADGPVEVDLARHRATDEGQDILRSIDIASGSNFDDILKGSSGSEQLAGGPYPSPDPTTDDGDDLIQGHGGRDQIFVGDGDDLLLGGPGGDNLSIFYAHSDLVSLGATQFRGGKQRDTLEMRYHHEGITVDLAAGTMSTATWNATLSSMENVVGTDHDDYIAGTNGPNRIEWGLHDSEGDVIEGRGGPDRISLGCCFYFGSAPGVAKAYGGAGDDLISAPDAAPAVLYGGDGDDYLSGDDAGDMLYGEGGNDRLFGDDGDDLLVGAVGADSFIGWEGEDTCDNEPGEEAVSCELSPPPKS